MHASYPPKDGLNLLTATLQDIVKALDRGQMTTVALVEGDLGA